MANVLLISAARLRNFTDLGNNYNTRDISNAVRAAQGDLEDIIGANLMQRFETDIQAGTTLPMAYQTLLNERIEPYLLQRSYWYMLETIFITPKSNGLGLRTSGASFTTASREVYYQKRKAAETKINKFEDKLKEYLRSNSSQFTELSSNTDIRSDRPDLDDTTQLPVVKRNRRNKRYRNKRGYGY